MSDRRFANGPDMTESSFTLHWSAAASRYRAIVDGGLGIVFAIVAAACASTGKAGI
jgi:hypothetical protein